MTDQPIRVLLVEDNPTDVLLLEEALTQVSSAQFELSQVERLAEAKERLSQKSFDIILLDLGLPDSQGLETLVKLREQAPLMPIVVLTGLTDEVFGLAALQEGAQDYLVKGQIKGPGLARVIRYGIERQRVEQALRESEAFNRVVLNSLSAHIAVLDRAGNITAINQAWERFARANGDPTLANTGIGLNYLEVCRQASGASAGEAPPALAGIQAVLNGSLAEFSLEYPCHSPIEKRWFLLQITPLPLQGGVVVSHLNVTERKQAEEALATERQRLRTLIDNLPDSIYLKDIQGRFIIGNIALARLLSLNTPDELIGKTDFDFFSPELAAQYHAGEQQIIQWGQPVMNREEPLSDLAGSRGWLSTTKVPLRDSQDQIVGLVGIGRDITERKQREEEIRRRNRELILLNQVIAASATELEPESILEIACRELAQAFEVPQATATLLNEEKTAALVVAEYLAVGSKGPLAPARPARLNTTTRVAASPALQYLLAHQSPLVAAEAQADPRLAPMHDLFRQHGTVSLLMLPLAIRDEVVGSLALEAAEARIFSREEINLAWSVAEQVAGVLIRARLTQTQQRLSAAIEQANDTVIITDTTGLIIYVNPAFERISGYSRAEATGQTTRILKSDQHEAAFYQELWATVSAGQVWRGRFANKRKDGALYMEDATITPVRSENGAIVNYVSVQHDVTRELELEQQYRQAQKMEAVGRLSGGVAHDFNNLLVVITGYSELLLDRHLKPDHPLRKYVEQIKLAGERAAGLTRQLLAFSRQQVLQPEILNLNEVVANTEKMLQRLIGEDIDLVTAPGVGLGQVKADPGQIEQVLLNLVINARDAMPKGGKLTIETANVELAEMYTCQHVDVTPGRYVMLAVSDTGIGMAAEVQAHIFEPFFTTKEQGKGTGLGLATVYGIVKQSGGDIWVYSEPGQGSTFKVYLPRLDEGEATLEPRPASLELPGGTETILLVEDEAAVRSLAGQVLNLCGYTVLAASHGGEALRLCEQQPDSIHLLLTDVVMPGGLNGRELADRLQPLHPELKVLFMSGYTDEAILRHGVLEPGLHFLQKPFTPNALAQKVRQVLDEPSSPDRYDQR